MLLLLVLGIIGYNLLQQSILYPFLFAAALIPGIFYLSFVRYSDVGIREPRGVIALHIIFGILLIFPAIILERFGIQILLKIGLTSEHSTNIGSILFWIFYALIIVAPVEELLKYCGSYIGNYFHSENDEASDSIVYSVAVAAGFALYENYRYVFGIIDIISFDEALILAIARSFTAIPLHLGVGMVMGYYLSGMLHPEKFGLDPEHRRRLFKRALIVPILIHGIYDLIVFMIYFNFYLQVGIALLFICIFTIFTWKKVEALRQTGEYGFIDLP